VRIHHSQYPVGFPNEAQAAVEGEKIRARKVFDQAKKELPETRYGSMQQVTKLLKQFIMSVFSVFASEACKLGRNGVWHVVDLHAECERFLGNFTDEAHASRGFDTNDHEIARNAINQRELMKYPEWEKYEDDRLEVANMQAAGKKSDEGTRQGYRREVMEWLRRTELENVEQAANKLGVSKSTLKSIMSSRGKIRYSADTLERILKIVRK